MADSVIIRLFPTCVRSNMGGATGECGGDNVPHFWDQRRTGGTGGGPMKIIFASMFINSTTRQQISIYSIDPYWYLLAFVPHIWKSGGTFFFRSLRSRILFCMPHLKIRGAPMRSNGTIVIKEIRPKIWPLVSQHSRSLKVIAIDTDRSATYDFPITFHSNYAPIPKRLRDKRRLQTKIAFPHPVYLTFPLRGYPLELGNTGWPQETRVMGLAGR